MILRDAGNQTVEGLTTAATVWVTAALGIACGLGAWLTLAAGVALAFVVLIGAGWIGHLMPEKDR